MNHWAPQPGDRRLPTQGNLFGHTVAFVPRARASDPQTSHEAAARVPEFSGGHYAKIHDALADHGSGTCWDIAEWSGLEHVKVARRLPEMEQRGVVRVIPGVKRKSPLGSPCRVWELVPEGMRR